MSPLRGGNDQRTRCVPFGTYFNSKVVWSAPGVFPRRCARHTRLSGRGSPRWTRLPREVCGTQHSVLAGRVSMSRSVLCALLPAVIGMAFAVALGAAAVRACRQVTRACGSACGECGARCTARARRGACGHLARPSAAMARRLVGHLPRRALRLLDAGLACRRLAPTCAAADDGGGARDAADDVRSAMDGQPVSQWVGAFASRRWVHFAAMVLPALLVANMPALRLLAGLSCAGLLALGALCRSCVGYRSTSNSAAP